MRAMFRLLAGCLACLVLAACGSGSSAGSDRDQIANLFNGMYTAMAHGDFAAACGYLTQRQQNNVVAGARRAGLSASSCSGALTSLLKQTGVSRTQLAQAFGAADVKRKINSISIHGNQATVTFTETSRGQTYAETDALVREGGRWRADRILKRGQSG
jgi:hypothetical protein